MPVSLRSRTKVAEGTPPAATNRRKRTTKEDDELNEEDTYGLVERELAQRPFELIEDLPCSIEPPQYSSALAHPLSVKDSAVLYSSMLNSRRTWVRAEMFDLYWSKQYLNAKEKERLIKEGIDPDTIDGSAAREKMHKLCDCYMTGGPHSFPVRLFILKNDDIEKRWNIEQEMKKKEKDERKKRESEEKKKKAEERKQQLLLKKQEIKLQKQASAKPPSSSVHEPKKRQPKKRVKKEVQQPKESSQQPQSIEDQKMITNLNIMAQKNPGLNSLMITVAGGRASSEQVEEFKKYIDKARNMPPPPGWQPVLTQEVKKEEKKKSRSKSDEKKKEQSSHQEKGKQKEKKSEVVNEEKGKKERGKQANEEKQNEEIPTDKTTKEKQLIDEVNDEQVSGEEKDQVQLAEKEKGLDLNESPELEKKDDTQVKAEDSSGVTTLGKPAAADSSPKPDQPRPKRKYTKRKNVLVAKDESAEEKSMQLTTFQQKYMNNADIVFEYLENPNIRYNLPKDAIFEQLEDEESYLMSWIVIHNKKDIEKYENKRLKELEGKTSRKVTEVTDESIESNKISQENNANEAEKYNVYADKDSPVPLYTPMTVKLSNIHKKFKPIIMNSVKPVEEVQEIMKRIIDRGTKLSGYNLWFQLDAYDDSQLAEELRYELKDYEQGFKSKRQKKQL